MLNKIDKHSQLKERKYCEEKSFNIQIFKNQYFLRHNAEYNGYSPCGYKESNMIEHTRTSNIIRKKKSQSVARRKKQKDKDWMARNNHVGFREKKRNDQIF